MQAHEQHHGRRLALEIQGNRLRTHRADQFGVDYLDQRLARTQAATDFLADGAFLYLRDEIPHHRQRDIGFQQRHADLAQAVLDIFFTEATAATQVSSGLDEPFAETAKHPGSTALLCKKVAVYPA